MVGDRQQLGQAVVGRKAAAGGLVQRNLRQLVDVLRAGLARGRIELEDADHAARRQRGEGAVFHQRILVGREHAAVGRDGQGLEQLVVAPSAGGVVHVVEGRRRLEVAHEAAVHPDLAHEGLEQAGGVGAEVAFAGHIEIAVGRHADAFGVHGAARARQGLAIAALERDHLADGHGLDGLVIELNAQVVEARRAALAAALIRDGPVAAIGRAVQAGDAAELHAVEQCLGLDAVVADQAQRADGLGAVVAAAAACQARGRAESQDQREQHGCGRADLVCLVHIPSQDGSQKGWTVAKARDRVVTCTRMPPPCPRPDRPLVRYSSLAPEALTTWAQRAISPCTMAANCCWFMPP